MYGLKLCPCWTQSLLGDYVCNSVGIMERGIPCGHLRERFLKLSTKLFTNFLFPYFSLMRVCMTYRCRSRRNERETELLGLLKAWWILLKKSITSRKQFFLMNWWTIGSWGHHCPLYFRFVNGNGKCAGWGTVSIVLVIVEYPVVFWEQN